MSPAIVMRPSADNMNVARCVAAGAVLRCL